ALTEVAAGVFELRLPIPFEDGLVNVFVFPDGDEADLLDCGMNSEESVGAIHRALEHLGAARVRRLMVTHIHPDHYGAAGTFACTTVTTGCSSPAITSCPSSRRTSACIPRARPTRSTNISKVSNAWRLTNQSLCCRRTAARSPTSQVVSMP